MATNYKQDLENEKKFSRYKSRLIWALCLLVGICLYGWMSVPRDLTLHYPPDLRNGGKQQAGEIPPENVYLFTKYILQHLHNWEENGAKDYEENRSRYRAFITPRFHQFIRDDIKDRKVDISYRRRELIPVPGSDYSSESVRLLGPNSWLVWLDFHVREWTRGTLVKDVYIRYPVRVVTYPVAKEANPWGLALDGYTDPGPQRFLKKKS